MVGEELGFVGCSLILLLLLLFMAKVLHVAQTARDDLGKYICFGYFGIIALQSISNIGMCLALLPAMGVTLPFFSAEVLPPFVCTWGSVLCKVCTCAAKREKECG